MAYSFCCSFGKYSCLQFNVTIFNNYLHISALKLAEPIKCTTLFVKSKLNSNHFIFIVDEPTSRKRSQVSNEGAPVEKRLKNGMKHVR